MLNRDRVHEHGISHLLSVFRYFPQGILASTLSSKLTCANFHRLGVVARAGERGSRAGNVSARTRHTVSHQLDVLPARMSVIEVPLHYGVTCLLALLVNLTSASAKLPERQCCKRSADQLASTTPLSSFGGSQGHC